MGTFHSRMIPVMPQVQTSAITVKKTLLKQAYFNKYVISRSSIFSSIGYWLIAYCVLEHLSSCLTELSESPYLLNGKLNLRSLSLRFGHFQGVSGCSPSSAAILIPTDVNNFVTYCGAYLVGISGYLYSGTIRGKNNLS